MLIWETAVLSLPMQAHYLQQPPCLAHSQIWDSPKEIYYPTKIQYYTCRSCLQGCVFLMSCTMLLDSVRYSICVVMVYTFELSPGNLFFLLSELLMLICLFLSNRGVTSLSFLLWRFALWRMTFSQEREGNGDPAQSSRRTLYSSCVWSPVSLLFVCFPAVNGSCVFRATKYFVCTESIGYGKYEGRVDKGWGWSHWHTGVH